MQVTKEAKTTKGAKQKPAGRKVAPAAQESPTAIAVNAFVEIDERARALRAKHPKIFAEYAAILTERNIALRIADKAVKESGEALGPWKVHSTRVEVSGERLFQLLGPERFAEVGGKLDTRTRYEVAIDLFDAAIAAQLVAPAVVNEVRSTRTSFSGPKEAALA